MSAIDILIVNNKLGGYFITELSSEELNQLTEQLHSNLDVLRKNNSDKNLIKKIDELSNSLNDIDFEDIKDKNTTKKLDGTTSFYKRFINALNKKVNIDPSRIMALTDGIFGMVMTLLIVSVSIPEQANTYLSFMTFIHGLFTKCRHNYCKFCHFSFIMDLSS